MEAEAKQARRELIADVLSEYPPKTAKRRGKHLNVYEEGNSDCGVKSNIKSIPGVMTVRGCAYAGAKGVVWGPIKDIVHVSHGPVGCGQYSWGQRRNYVSGAVTGVNSWVVMQMTSNFQEKDIVFGGDKKLAKLIDEIESIFPLNRGISVMSECPVGLIGDDIEAVAKTQERGNRQGDRPGALRRLPRRVAIARPSHRQRRDARHIVDKSADKPFESTPYDVLIVGDYNIGGDAWASRILIEEMGLRVIGQWSGDASVAEVERGAKAKLNLIHCYRSMNYICRHMEEKYGIPWIEYNFFGPSQIAKSLRAIAAQFDDSIKEGAERVIAKYRPLADAVLAKYRPRLEGKRIMLYVGGLRPRHVSDAYGDLGMEVTATGYEFAHADDYQRTTEYIKDGTLVYDDASEFELEKFIQNIRPDLVGSGIKEKYGTQKLGVPFRQMHSWDYSGPYHGYDGFAVFARDMDLAINNPVWGMHKAPWKTA